VVGVLSVDKIWRKQDAVEAQFMFGNVVITQTVESDVRSMVALIVQQDCLFRICTSFGGYGN
jgi:hypothetical protein